MPSPEHASNFPFGSSSSSTLSRIVFRVGPITLKTLKRKETDFEPKTVGDHLRKRRLQLGLTQKAFAKLLRVNQCTWASPDFPDTT